MNPLFYNFLIYVYFILCISVLTDSVIDTNMCRIKRNRYFCAMKVPLLFFTFNVWKLMMRWLLSIVNTSNRPKDNEEFATVCMIQPKGDIQPNAYQADYEDIKEERDYMGSGIVRTVTNLISRLPAATSIHATETTVLCSSYKFFFIHFRLKNRTQICNDNNEVYMFYLLL